MKLPVLFYITLFISSVLSAVPRDGQDPQTEETQPDGQFQNSEFRDGSDSDQPSSQVTDANPGQDTPGQPTGQNGTTPDPTGPQQHGAQFPFGQGQSNSATFPCQCTCTGVPGNGQPFPINHPGFMPGTFGQPWQGGFAGFRPNFPGQPFFPNQPGIFPQQQWQQSNPFGQGIQPGQIQGNPNFGQPGLPNFQGGFGQRPQPAMFGRPLMQTGQEQEGEKKLKEN